MTIEPNDFQGRLRTLLGLHSLAFTDEELARMADRYGSCTGKDPWDVRQYAGRAGMGAREYRVMRGTGVGDIYRSRERAQADAVGAALNALESEVKS
ncbi:MAG TPA: hypothetical protein VGV12_05640 [Gemmatimonadales bacterium]|nr:hypothetical protein [Gemmatimonadales bacterium]